MLEVLRSGRLSLGPTIDRFEELFAAAVGAPYAAAVSRGTAGLHLLCVSAGIGARRRGDHVAVLVRRVGELLHLRGRDAGLRGHRPADAEPRSGRGRGGDHAADEGDRRGRHLRLSVRARRAARDLRAARARADRGRVRGARRRYKGAPIGSHGPPAVFAFYPNKQITTGEGGMVTTHSEEEWRLLRSLRNQGRGDDGGWLEHARLGFNYRLDDIARRARHRAAREARRDPRAARARSRRATASCSPASTASRLPLRRRRRPRALVVRLRREAARRTPTASA